MGIGRLLKSNVDPQVLGEETISAQEKTYAAAKRLFPQEDPHTLLARVWLARMAARGTTLGTNEDLAATLAMSETQQFACVSAPQNARALGLFFLSEENPQIAQNSQFTLEFEGLMAPVFRAIEKGEIRALYKKHNPNLTWKFIE